MNSLFADRFNMCRQRKSISAGCYQGNIKILFINFLFKIIQRLKLTTKRSFISFDGLKSFDCF